MAQLLIIADDVTGAADSGVQFALRGLSTIVQLRPSVVLNSDVLVVVTHNRELDEFEAVQANRHILTPILEEQHPDYILQKVDSTLRGHPSALLCSTMMEAGVNTSLVAPALPAQGRTTIGGRQYVDGRWLVESEFGEVVASDDLLAIFASDEARAGVSHIPLQAVREDEKLIADLLSHPSESANHIFVADAESDEDLTRLVHACVTRGMQLFCGSAGLAQALARALPLRANFRADIPQSRYRGPVLVMAGSRHTRTRKQIDIARWWGLSIITVDDKEIAEHGDTWPEMAVQRAIPLLATDRSVIVTTGRAHLDPDKLLEGMRTIVHRVTQRITLGGVVLTGGDVALAALDALDATQLALTGEVEAGIPIGNLLDGTAPGLPVVTKAGGFGSEQALLRAINRLRPA